MVQKWQLIAVLKNPSFVCCHKHKHIYTESSPVCCTVITQLICLTKASFFPFSVLSSAAKPRGAFLSLSQTRLCFYPTTILILLNLLKASALVRENQLFFPLPTIQHQRSQKAKYHLEDAHGGQAAISTLQTLCMTVILGLKVDEGHC